MTTGRILSAEAAGPPWGGAAAAPPPRRPKFILPCMAHRPSLVMSHGRLPALDPSRQTCIQPDSGPWISCDEGYLAIRATLDTRSGSPGHAGHATHAPPSGSVAYVAYVRDRAPW
jgi:hypothetical protein